LPDALQELLACQLGAPPATIDLDAVKPKWNAAKELFFAEYIRTLELNGGPGAVGGLYVHQQFADDPGYRRMGGWWGNDEKTRFKMEKGFVPKAGAEGWQLSTAQVFNMVSLKASLTLFEEAGIHSLRHKSLRLTSYLEFLLRSLRQVPFDILTPSDPLQRGAQLSLYFKENAKEIHKRLIAKGLVVDYREPGVIRFAPAPLYNSFEDVYRVYEILKTIPPTP